MQSKKMLTIATLAAILALMVVMLGAYTRLTHAGLGCPDWPGCYGHLVLPSAKNVLSEAQKTYPAIPIEERKAWTEMAHRYAAGTLALLIFFIAGHALFNRFRAQKGPFLLPLFLAILVLFQAALGMWTVTMKLLPVVVMGHLLGGILIFSCLCLYRLQLDTYSQRHPECNEGSPINRHQPSSWRSLARLGMTSEQNINRYRFWIGLGAVIVFCQIALGGWVSANYAGISCMGFPRCNGQWLPTLQFYKGFNLFSPVGANYQGGVLDSAVRVTIQYIHRVGALVTATYVLILSLLLFFRTSQPKVRYAALAAIFLLILQLSLGILNVIFLLPIGVAVAHNGVAALLMANFLVLFYFSRSKDIA